jgi:hypothetical protein
MSKYEPITTLFCSLACKNKACSANPTPERLAQAKVTQFQLLKRLGCGYIPLVKLP